MSELNYWAVAVAAIAGFVAAFVYYAVLGGRLAAAGGAVTDERPPAWIPLFELAKHLVLAAVVAGLLAALVRQAGHHRCDRQRLEVIWRSPATHSGYYVRGAP